MYALTAEELKQLLEEKESKSVEFKESIVLNNDEEVLRQLTAFANRFGGNILFGVRNDRTLEGVTIDSTYHIERISNLVRDKTSPIVEWTPRFYHGADGDVLALRIFKRRDIPCAVVDRALHEIKIRRYFIRTNSGVRIMDDRTLEWLFVHQEDPAIHQNFQICVQYFREDVSLKSWIWDFSLLPFQLNEIFQSLTEEQRKFLKSNESNNMQKFLVEVMPYAILSQLSWVYSGSWKVKVERVKGRTTYSHIPAPSKQVKLGQLTSPDVDTILSKLSFEMPSVLFKDMSLSLPLGTIVEVGVEKLGAAFTASTISIRKAKAFNIAVRITPSLWSVGAAPGHPLGQAFGGIHRGDEQLTVQDKFAHACFDVTFNASFEFPDEQNDDIQEHFDWAQQLLTEIRSQWDWDAKVGSLPPGLLYSIDRDVREILEHIRRKGRQI